MHSYKDPIKRQIANEKRRKTNTERYGSPFPLSSSQISKQVKDGYAKTKQFIEKLPILDKNETIKMLTGEKFNYLKFFGKAKNRTLLKLNPVLYKSLFFKPILL